jgi:hypothetical protein
MMPNEMTGQQQVAAAQHPDLVDPSRLQCRRDLVWPLPLFRFELIRMLRPVPKC